jgi:mRNA-degrading endonuclease RelE of RelBE toxin-antitoxin system
MRVADYRVLYRLEDGNRLMVVTDVRHRSEVYD